MKLKNLTTLEIVRLPFEFYWLNEFEGSPLEEREERGATGTLHIHQQEKEGGRPFKVGADPESNWIKVSELRLLYSWLRTTGVMIEVSEIAPFDNRVFKVSFNQSEKNPIEATPVITAVPLDEHQYYHATFNFRIHKELTL